MPGKAKQWAAVLLYFAAAIMRLVAWGGGLLLHLCAVFFAFGLWGAVGALLALALPGLAEIVVAAILWGHFGPDTAFVDGCFAWVILMVLHWLALAGSARLMEASEH